MKSELPKVLHTVCGVPMLEHVLVQLENAISLPRMANVAAEFNIVVGHGREAVVAHVNDLSLKGQLKVPVRFTTQEEQKGTGHAVLLALQNGNTRSDITAVFNGDLPMFTADAFVELFEAHLNEKSVASLASMKVAEPGAYGRVVRKGKTFQSVVEYKDATSREKLIQEVNGGVYLFSRQFLDTTITQIGNKNKSGEFYLPKVFELGKKKGKKILAHIFADEALLWGVNNLSELSHAQKSLYRRTAESWMKEGVRFFDPETSYVGPYVKIGKGSVVGPGTILDGHCNIGERVHLGGYSYLKDTDVASDSILKMGVYAEKSSIGAGSQVGPMAQLRPGSQLKSHVKVGNFVEIKESEIGDHTSISHLSYVGDAEVGDHVNIGCGFVTCNYDGTVRDGRRKHRSVIGDRVFIGSDCQVVAPINIADGTFIASGSTVTDSVSESDSLVLARTRQVTKPGYAKKYRK